MCDCFCDCFFCELFFIFLLIVVSILMIGSLFAEPSLLFSYMKQYDHPAFLEANYDIKNSAIALIIIAALTLLMWIATLGSLFIFYDSIQKIVPISSWSLFLSLAFIVSCTLGGKAAISNLPNFRDYSIYYPIYSDEEYFGSFFVEKAVKEGCNETGCLIGVIDARFKIFNRYSQIIMYIYIGTIIFMFIFSIIVVMEDHDWRGFHVELFFLIIFGVFIALPIYMLAMFGQKTFNDVCKAYEIKNYKNYLFPILGLVGCILFFISVKLFDYRIIFCILNMSSGAFVFAQAVLIIHLYLKNFNKFTQKVPVIDSFKNIVNAMVYIQAIFSGALLLTYIIIFIMAFFKGDSQNCYNCLARYIYRVVSIVDVVYNYFNHCCKFRKFRKCCKCCKCCNKSFRSSSDSSSSVSSI